jgi:hypothetical protein
MQSGAVSPTLRDMGLTAALVASYLGVFLPALGALVCLLVRVSA